MQTSQYKKMAAEFVGTFALVFAGTGAIVVNDVSGGVVTHMGIAMTFGLIVIAMIYTVGDVSGAHLNPAVTVGLCAARQFSAKDVPAYIGSQLAGAFMASFTLKFAFRGHNHLGATLPHNENAGVAFVLEILLTFMLMFVILNMTQKDARTKRFAGIVIGGVVGLEALFAGPISGASMNPARSIAPAVASGQLQFLWIYVAAPLVGALLAVPGCRSIQGTECCSTANCVE